MSSQPVARPLASTIGIKVLMGVTGCLLLIFVIIHMLGNLQIFLPATAINSYAYHLQGLPFVVLWGFRVGLLLTAILHIWSVIRLLQINRAARPEAYEVRRALRATWASRTMEVSGVIVLIFIVFHLWQFTIRGRPFGAYNTMQTTITVDGQPMLVPDVSQRVVTAFSHPLVALFYVISVGFLCLHLSHGAQSMFRSLGLGTAATFGWQRAVARALALAIFLGMASVPLSVLFGLIR